MKSLSYLNKYFYKYRLRLLLGILFIAIQNYFGAKMPVVLGDATDHVLEAIKNNSSKDVIFKLCLYSAGFYVLFSIIKGLFLFFTRQTIIVMSRHIEFDLKNEIYDKYQKLHFNFYKSQATGDLMNRISEDVAQVRQYLGPGIMYTVNLAFLLPMMVFQMGKISWELTFYSLLPLPLMTILIYFVSSKMNKLSKDVQAEQSMLSTIGQETFAGIRIIKAYIQEQQTAKRFNKSSEEYRKRNMRLVLVNALFMPTITFLIGSSVLLSVYIGGLLTYSGDITPGNILTFISCVGLLTWPFASVGWVTSINQRAAASQQRINEFLHVEEAITNHSDEKLESLEKIQVNNLSFAYPSSSKEVLTNINFELNKGETLGIIGRTGCGKSTLVNLLIRLIDPTSGEIIYNSTSLKDINLDGFRSIIGVVTQDVFLFSDTIKNNIAFGSQGIEYSQEAIEKAAKDAHVLHNIVDFPDQFETLLGERGVNLSGGQKQRLSIARALIRQPKLLVLDDCLSAVDTETEEIILTNLKKLTKDNDTTTIIVSHRISSLRNADKIIVIDEGTISESGTHESLLALDGLYAEMYEKQLMEKED